MWHRDTKLVLPTVVSTELHAAGLMGWTAGLEDAAGPKSGQHGIIIWIAKLV
jgi:hypothetical protein